MPCDTDIDENSLIEDEEPAHQALQDGNPESDKARDILDDHRKRNRANKPPNEQLLLNAAKRQLGGTHNTHSDVDDDVDDVSNVDGTGDTAGEKEDDENENACRRRARRKKPDEPDPKTAGYYPNCWREAIDRAKELFRRYTILYHLFPGRDEHLRNAAWLLSKVVADERSEGKLFDEGKFFTLMIHHCTDPSAPTDFEQTRDMNIVVSKIF